VEKLLTPYVPAVGLATTLAVFVYTASQWLNKSAENDIKLRVSLWLLGGVTKTTIRIDINAIFKILFGHNLSIKRLKVVIILTSTISIAALIWFDRVYLRGLNSDYIYTLYDYTAFSILIMFKGSTAVYIAYVFIGSINTICLNKMSGLRIYIFTLSAIVCIFFANVVIMNVIDAPGFLTYKKIWTGALAERYDEFMFDYNGLINFENPIFVASYLVPIIWIVVVWVIFLISKAASSASIIVARLSPWLSQERIEKEPIALLGEAVAGIIFILVVFVGVLLSVGDNSHSRLAPDNGSEAASTLRP
jgi:hypothetical protein